MDIWNNGLKLVTVRGITQFGVRPSEERIYYCERWVGDSNVRITKVMRAVQEHYNHNHSSFKFRM